MLAYSIAPALRERRVRRGDRLDRLRGDRGDRARTTAPRCRSCGRPQFAGDTSPDIEWLEHTLAELRRPGPDLGLLQPAAADQPVPHGRHDPPRLAALRCRSRLSTRCGRSRSARSTRARCGWCAASGCCRCCRSSQRGPAVAQHAVPGAAAGLRAERVARDRLDARRVRAAHDCRRRARAVPHRRATKGSTSTTRPTGWWPERLLAHGQVTLAPVAQVPYAVKSAAPGSGLQARN